MAVIRLRQALPLGILLVSILASVGTPARPAGAADLWEYQVKAAFLYNFAKFVTWPEYAPFPGPETPFLLCVVGEDPFGKALEAIEGKPVQGHPLEVQRLAPEEEVPADCRILFLAVRDPYTRKALLAELPGRAILTVAEYPGFLEEGGMINMVAAGGRVRFEVNAGAAGKAGLKVSSQLLKLAVRVLGGETAGSAP